MTKLAFKSRLTFPIPSLHLIHRSQHLHPTRCNLTRILISRQVQSSSPIGRQPRAAPSGPDNLGGPQPCLTCHQLGDGWAVSDGGGVGVFGPPADFLQLTSAICKMQKSILILRMSVNQSHPQFSQEKATLSAKEGQTSFQRVKSRLGPF